MTGRVDIYGLAGLFDASEALHRAARALRENGFSHLDAYTPFPVGGLAATLGHRAAPIGWLVFWGAAVGAILVYGLQLYSVTIAYPVNVGGRALHAWPAFLVPAFEAGILGGALAGFFGLLFFNRLPQPYHPIFNTPGFSLGTGKTFCLVVTTKDPQFDADKAIALFDANGARQVEQVPW